MILKGGHKCPIMESWPEPPPSLPVGKERLMGMSLDEFLVDHPVDRAVVDAHKRRMLNAIDEAQYDDAEKAQGCIQGARAQVGADPRAGLGRELMHALPAERDHDASGRGIRTVAGHGGGLPGECNIWTLNAFLAPRR